MNNVSFILLSLFYCVKAFACDLQAPIRHTNPDGTIGGLVDIRSLVDEEAYIALNATVCGRAVLEAGAKILDFSKVEDDAWIRSNSIIKDYASVGGSSYVEGELQNVTIIEGRAKISGSPKIVYGSLIKDFSVISGQPKLFSVTTNGSAEICGEYNKILIFKA